MPFAGADPSGSTWSYSRRYEVMITDGLVVVNPPDPCRIPLSPFGLFGGNVPGIARHPRTRSSAGIDTAQALTHG